MVKANLVIQTAFLGDLILAVPTFRKIKSLAPESPLIVVCKKGLGDFLIKNNIADFVFEVEKSNRKSYSLVLQQLQNHPIQNLYCLHRSVRSLLFSAQIRAGKKIAFTSLLGHLIFDKLVPYRKSDPEVIRQFRILVGSGMDELSDYSHLNRSGENGDLPTVPGEFAFSGMKKTSSRGEKKYIAVFPGSVWATKKWTQSGFIELTKLLLENGYEVFLMGDPSEKPLCEEIALKAGGGHVLNGLSIAQSLEKISDMDLVVSNDSAPAHMAAFHGVPVVAIFGPTTSAMGFRPWSLDSQVVEHRTLSCRPCGPHGHKECPLGHHLCMKEIPATAVFAAIRRSLSH